MVQRLTLKSNISLLALRPDYTHTLCNQAEATVLWRRGSGRLGYVYSGIRALGLRPRAFAFILCCLLCRIRVVISSKYPVVGVNLESESTSHVRREPPIVREELSTLPQCLPGQCSPIFPPAPPFAGGKSGKQQNVKMRVYPSSSPRVNSKDSQPFVSVGYQKS